MWGMWGSSAILYLQSHSSLTVHLHHHETLHSFTFAPFLKLRISEPLILDSTSNNAREQPKSRYKTHWGYGEIIVSWAQYGTCRPSGLRNSTQNSQQVRQELDAGTLRFTASCFSRSRQHWQRVSTYLQYTGYAISSILTWETQRRIQGLEKDLGMKGKDYNTALFIFFVTYIACEIPSNILLKHGRPSIWLSGMIVCWGELTAICHQRFSNCV